IKAIESCLDLLKVGGLIILVVYHGHEGGATERDVLLNYVSSLPQSFVHVLKYEFVNQQNHPPFVLVIEKMKYKR
ncbi:MAG: class I SAM-dependent methyltransferase, partial [Paenisporosarcina sp.]